MATTLELVRRGDLERWDAQLDPDEQEYREIYLVQQVVQALPKLLQTMVSKWQIELTPAQQLDEITYNFVSGGRLDYPRHFHEIYHRGDGFWELRTPDLRMFGFFPRIDCFICTDIADKNKIAQYNLTTAFVKQGQSRRDLLDLDEPKWIEGTEPEDVVSNCYRSKKPSRS